MTKSMAKMSVTVCIASIGRVSLLSTLKSLVECNLPDQVMLDVVIADDSATGAIESMLNEQLVSFPYNLTIIPSASGNIAIARNTCLTNASGDYLAFIDDDETADKDWIAYFVNLAISTNADAIFGPVDAVYPINAPQWICDAKPFFKRVGMNGDIVKTGSTCNAFVKNSVINKFGLSFRPDLGKSGGEDTAFFAELSRHGALLIASENAMVYEEVSIERLNVNHLGRRYVRGGQTYANLFISSATVAKRLSSYVSAMVKILVLLPLIILSYPMKKGFALKCAFKFWLNIGKLRNLFNMPIISLY